MFGFSLQTQILNRKPLSTIPALLLAIFFAHTVSVNLLGAEEPQAQVDYRKSTAMIPMRDGVRLYTEIYSPVDQAEALPILFLRTPYQASAGDDRPTRYFSSTFRELAKQRYIIVVQDARGRHQSEGKFEWNRPVRHHEDTEAIDASTDAYDSIEWLVNNTTNNNGRVGMLGVSYPGWYVTMALVDSHPALKAASPQASPTDYFIGDDFYHFGAFRLSPSAELPYLFDFDPKQNSRFPYDQVDTYEFFLDLGPLSNMNKKYLHGVSPTWDNFMKHATYDEFWKTGATLPHLTEVSVPTLNVVGWWDAENLGGALDLYHHLEALDKDDLNWLVVGPWSHGQWASGPTDRLGEYEFDSDTVAYYQQQIEAKFFAYFLKDEGELDLPEATLFQTGGNEWQAFESWPPIEEEDYTTLYLRADGGLAFEPPVEGESEFESYVSDPDKPVPFSARPIMGFWSGLSGSSEPRFARSGKLWKVEDQRFVSDRPDVLTFVTEPLAEDVALAGEIEVRLFGSTSGTDCDWVAKLIDVYPESYSDRPEMGGFQLMIADDVIRGKFRDGFEEPQPLSPGEVDEFVIDLRTRNHLFKKGHRIMLHVQSSWFPLIDRNPQRFVDIPNATESDFQKAEQRVYFSPDYPSQIRMSLIEKKD